MRPTEEDVERVRVEAVAPLKLLPPIASRRHEEWRCFGAMAAQHQQADVPQQETPSPQLLQADVPHRETPSLHDYEATEPGRRCF